MQTGRKKQRKNSDLHFSDLNFVCLTTIYTFPGDSDIKESACNVGDLASIPGLGRSPGEEKWQSTPVFLPRESHGQRNQAGYSQWDHKELDTAE